MRAGIAALLVAAMLAGGGSWAGNWQPIIKDGVRDPDEPGIQLLQNPEEALSKLPPDTAGNQVNWIKALEDGVINPRSSLLPETKVNILDLDVIMKRTGEMPMVRFPHRQHTAWLDCTNCHDHLFNRKAGTSTVNMFLILSGEKCGLCHGAVAFPLTECKRCHSVYREKIR